MADEITGRGLTNRGISMRAVAGRAVLAAGLAAGAVLLSPGAANAAPVAGPFTGLEYPPTAVLYNQPSPLCATFDPLLVGSSPLRHEFAIPGGTATFTSSARYDANPEGLYPADSNCVGATVGVVGSLMVTAGVTCTIEATYTRRATSAYALTSTAPCGGSMVAFVGTQVPCVPFKPCSDPDAGASMDGVYVQS